jgi:hypothetical protein
MTFVCLSRLAGPIVAGSGAEEGGVGAGTRAVELAPRLLTAAPRVRAEARGLIWADARGLPARPLAVSLLALLRERGRCLEPHAGIARTAIAAEVASVFGRETIVEVPIGGEREFLAAHDVSVLGPEPRLARLLEGTGIEHCGDLARLDQAAVEVRLGQDGVALWRLSRADDPRRLFDPTIRALPEASLEWSDYVLRDPERLLFAINGLAGTVCSALRETGQGATAFTLAFALAGGATVEQAFSPSRANANQRTWMRLIRDVLERIRLPDAVVGVFLRVDAAARSEIVQGDILDRGFGTAQVAEEALARILDQGSVVVTPENSRHALLTRRTRWVEQPPALVWARPQIGPEDTEPALALHLWPEPAPVEVAAADRRGFAAPLRYRRRGDGRDGHDGRDGWLALVSASGPDCVSGGQWDEAYACELYCCVRDDGAIVLLSRDARSGEWQEIGEWR